jgi:hypothetical protein
VGDEGAATSASLAPARAQAMPSSWRRPAEELVEAEPGRDRVAWIALVVGVVLCAGVALLIRQAGCAVAPAPPTPTSAAHAAAPAATAGPPDTAPRIDPSPVVVGAGSMDAGSMDAGSMDAGSMDAGSMDAGSMDAGSMDAGASVAGAAGVGDGPPAAMAAGPEGAGGDAVDDNVATDGGGRGPRPAPEDDDGVDPDPPPGRR